MTIEQTFQLALTHHRAGRRGEAEAHYRQVLAADPKSHAAMSLLGALLAERGDFIAAAAMFARAADASPATPEYQVAVGMTLLQARQPAEAAAAFQRAVKLQPGDADALHQLGRALTLLGKLDDAIAALRAAAAISSTAPPLQADLANALRRRGLLDEALASAQRAIAIDPRFAWGHNILGLIHADLGDQQRSLDCYKNALARQPNLVEGYVNIAELRRRLGQWTQCAADLRTAIRLRPNDPGPHHNLGGVLTEMGLTDEAIASLRQAMALAPSRQQSHSSLLYTMHFHPGFSPRQRFEEHQRWAAMHAATFSRPPHNNDRDPHRRLRIGYVSADLRQHPVCYFIEPLLAAHDRAQFEVYCYADLLAPDATTARLRELPLVWRNIAALDDASLAEVIRGDGIDVLIDLGGHTEHNRLLAFARIPAPVQFSYLGYPDTTAVPGIGYRLTDAHADPPGAADSLHTETLIRLPTGFLCYRPPPDSPPLAPPPSAASGIVTFASFNNLAKLSAPAVELFARVLNAAEGSRLLLKNRALGDPQIAARIAAAFASHGIARQRLDLRPPQPNTTAHLEVYNQADIALDTFPYNGTTTTCEALWMGVPVITLTGDAHVSRVGTSLLHSAGFTQWIAQTPEEFIDIATSLARDPARLCAVRAGMRDRMKASPLMDEQGFAQAVEAAYRETWRKWCATGNGKR